MSKYVRENSLITSENLCSSSRAVSILLSCPLWMVLSPYWYFRYSPYPCKCNNRRATDCMLTQAATADAIFNFLHTFPPLLFSFTLCSFLLYSLLFSPLTSALLSFTLCSFLCMLKYAAPRQYNSLNAWICSEQNISKHTAVSSQ